MGYILRAFIGKKTYLTSIQVKYTSSKLVDLNHEISMIPMTDELFDEMNKMIITPGILSFKFLTENIEKITLQLIGNHELAYVESEFLGGQGGHVGIIWKNGKRNFVGHFKRNTMNEILNKLGVIKTSFKDEFETIGLNKHRHTEDWIE